MFASEPYLHAHDHVPVPFYGLSRQGRVGVAQVEQFTPRVVLREGRLSDHRNIQQGEDTGLGGIDDVLAEPWECVCSRGARVNCSGHALGDAVGIRGYAQRCDAVVHMGVDIDPARASTMRLEASIT